MPAGELVTDPVPVPASVTDAVNNGAKVATTAVFASNVTVQEPVPTHAAPLHPTNVDPGEATALKLIEVPKSNAAVHVAPQLIPAGVLDTTPLPDPAAVTARLYCGFGAGPKFATTAWLVFNVTLHEPLPEQAPLQPVNAEPAAGVAASETTVFAL